MFAEWQVSIQGWGTVRESSSIPLAGRIVLRVNLNYRILFLSSIVLFDGKNEVQSDYMKSHDICFNVNSKPYLQFDMLSDCSTNDVKISPFISHMLTVMWKHT